MTNTFTEQDEFVRLLEESYNYKFSVADVVKGIVIKQENDGFLVDIGAKTEAFLPNREITNNTIADRNYSDYLTINDVKEFYILKEEADDLIKELSNQYGIDYSIYNKFDVFAVYYDWEECAVDRLKHILDETNSKIIISSGWRSNRYPNKMKDLLTY